MCTLFSFLLYLWWDVVDLFFLLDWGRFLNLITLCMLKHLLSLKIIFTRLARQEDRISPASTTLSECKFIYTYLYIYWGRQSRTSLCQLWESEWHKQLRVMLGRRQQLEVKGIFAAWHFAMEYKNSSSLLHKLKMLLLILINIV